MRRTVRTMTAPLIALLTWTAGSAYAATPAPTVQFSAATSQMATAAEGPIYSRRFFTTPLEKDPSREVSANMGIHLPGRPGTSFHSHNGDQWEVVLEGEMTFTVKGQPPRVLKTGESVYVPRGVVHRNENLSDAPTRTLEFTVTDKGKPASNRVN